MAWRAISAEPLPQAAASTAAAAAAAARVDEAFGAAAWQGLTLVHYSAQPEPFWSVSGFVSSV